MQMVDDLSSKCTVETLPDQENCVRVRFRYGDAVEMDLDELQPVDTEQDKKDAAEMQASIDEAKSAFEKAFEAFSKVNEHPKYYYLQEEGLVSMKELYASVEQAGWAASTFRCM